MTSNPSICTRTVLVALFLALSVFASQHASAQEISTEQKGRLARIKSLVDQGGKLFKSKDFSESADKIRDAQEEFGKLASAGDKAILDALKKDHERIATAQRLLAEKGEEFDDFPALDSFHSMGDKKSIDDSDSKEMNPKMDDKEMISFTLQIAPIILEHCGQCHVQQSRGKYSAANYTSLKKGTSKGAAVKPRDLKKSRMIVLIEDGIMPPKGEVPAEHLQILKDWIAQGAKFDGEAKQKNENLTAFAPPGDGDKGTADDSGNSGGEMPDGDDGIPSRGGDDRIPSRGAQDGIPSRGGGGR